MSGQQYKIILNVAMHSQECVPVLFMSYKVQHALYVVELVPAEIS